MNQEQKIINKLYEAKRLELKAHEVKLSDYVDVVGIYNQIEKNYNAIIKQTASARTELKKSVGLLQEQDALTNNFNSQLSLFEKKAKELGVDYKTTFPEFVKYEDAIRKQYAPQNFKEVLTAYDNL
jgi:hypothetical protein